MNAESLDRLVSETCARLRLAKNAADEMQIEAAVSDLLAKLDTILSSSTSASASKSHHIGDFFKFNSDRIVEIIKVVTDLLDQIKCNDHQLVGKYSQTVTGFAESTSVFSLTSDSTSVLNKLIEFLIRVAAPLATCKSTTFEVCRAMGSLIYQNSYKLSDSNLSRMLDDDKSQQSLLFGLRERIEREYQCYLTSDSELSPDHQLESIKRLDLITAQLVCNLTIPGGHVVTSDQTQSVDSTINNSTPPTIAYHFISDKYKQKCGELAGRIIKFHQVGFNNNKQSCSDDSQIEFRLHKSKILCKCLQSYENLFMSIKSPLIPTTTMTTRDSNWLKDSMMTNNRLGDILAVCKELSFFGLTKIGKSKLVVGMSLEPSHVHEILGSSSNNKLATTATMASDGEEEPATTDGINYGDAKSRNNKAKPFVSYSNNRSPNKKPHQHQQTYMNNQSGGGGPDKSRFNKKTSNVRNNPRLSNNEANKSSTSTSIETTNYLNTNSLQCLKQTQVPLVVAVTHKSNAADSDSLSINTGSNNYQIDKSNAMVRVSSLAVLLTIFQSLEHKVVLSYWQSFIGSSGGSNEELNLIWSVKYDESPKVRLIASQALAAYLESARAFFTITASEDSTTSQSISSQQQQQQQQASFLPISHTIAHLIRQLHRDLVVSLCQREKFAVNQLHLIKCLRCLIKSTPYAKLRPGLVYKLVLNLNILLMQKSKYKDPTSTLLVNELLSCLEMILSQNSQMMETHLALMATASSFNTNLKQKESGGDLSDKLEQLNLTYKMPVLTKMPVTYFYDGNMSLFFSNKSSLNNSNLVSGQQTPTTNLQSFNELISDDDVKGGDNCEIGMNGKPWLVDFCIQNGRMTSEIDQPWRRIGPGCLSLLQVVCSKYFDVMRKETFLDEISKLFMDNINHPLKSSSSSGLLLQEHIELMKQKTLKLLEEFARCIATDEMRHATGLDLNDCCTLWSMLLNQSSLVSELLSDEQHYLLSSSACDCLASIGSSIFELLTFNTRVYCLTSLLHRTKSHSTLIRAASARSLGVYVTFGSLKEDQNFLSDLALTLITLLAGDANNLVRQKAAWSMSNLSEVLIENALRLGRSFTHEFNLVTWQRCVDTVSESCVREGDKVKSYLVRTLGNLINYISFIDNNNNNDDDDDRHIGLSEKQIEVSVTNAITALCSCRTVKMLKVKWNLSYSIGVAMRQFSSLQIVSLRVKSTWLAMFYDTLLELFTQSFNFKVRINACIALVSVNLNENSDLVRSSNGGGGASIYLKLWLALIDAFSKLKHEAIDADNELQHKNNLIHQLCKLMTYLCKYLKQQDLEQVKLECLNRIGLVVVSSTKTMYIGQLELRQHLVAYLNSIHAAPDNYKTEIQFYNEAVTQLNLLSANKKTSVDEDCVNLLKNILQKPTLEATTATTTTTDNGGNNDSDHSEADVSEYRKKFPFSQVYD